MNNMCEQVLAIKRIEAVIEARNRLIEMHEGLVYVSETDSHKELSKAYEKFEQSYVDIIIAEAKYLESLKEATENKQEELTVTKVTDEDLEYLSERVEKKLKESKYMHLKGAIFIK
jgi:vacuolar-type H+-ATPase subunit F/Vma7